MKIILSILTLVVSTFFLSAQGIIYVDSSQVSSGNGLSWATAYSNFQQALEVAQPGQQIWVAKGTYVPSKDFNGNVPSDLKKTTFTLRKGVKIYGGFIGIETNISQRNWRANKSVLSGFHGPKQSEVVIRGDSIDSTAVLDGFYITKSKGNDNSIRGGGVFLRYSNLILSNLVIHQNEAYCGGGIGMQYSSPFMINLIISENKITSTGGDSGGGVFIEQGSPIMTNCQITQNISPQIAGGMCCVNASPTVFNATISGNIAPFTPSGFRSGVIYNLSRPSFPPSKPTFFNSILEGGIYNSINSVPSFTKCIGVYGRLFGQDTIFGIDGGGNLDTSIYYTDSTNGNYIPAHCSPNIDAGSNQYLPKDFLDLDYDGDTTELLPVDLFGRPRVQNGIVDMGAFEGSSSSDTVEAKLCYGDTLSVSGNLITRQGVSLLAFPRVGLCDSLIYYDVQSPIDPKITVNATNKTLTASISNAKYQWYDCTNAFALPGDTNQVFSPWVASSYSVIITENGCTDTSECVNVTQVGLPEVNTDLKLNVFPNPSAGLYNIQFSETLKNVELQLFDLTGKVIQSKKLNSIANTTLEISGKPEGLYLLKVISEKGSQTYRLTKR